MNTAIAAALTSALGAAVDARSARLVGGGSIHTAYRCQTKRGVLFVKTASIAAAACLAAEAEGLRELANANANALRTPQVVASGNTAEGAFLALEWFDFAPPNSIVEIRLGEQLAALHRREAREHGWRRDNFIGTTVQRNTRTDDWVQFFRTQRLEPQLHLAQQNGAAAGLIDRGQLLCESLEAFFATYRPVPSLLHGDLWGGNWGATRDDVPVIFDPAVYFGDRETDIAMTRLFGGFSSEFYAAYAAAWPLDAGATSRVTLYNLYHMLNHFNLFGGRYLAPARSMLDASLAQIGR